MWIVYERPTDVVTAEHFDDPHRGTVRGIYPTEAEADSAAADARTNFHRLHGPDAYGYTWVVEHTPSHESEGGYVVQARQADATWQRISTHAWATDALEKADALAARIPDHMRDWHRIRVVDRATAHIVTYATPHNPVVRT